MHLATSLRAITAAITRTTTRPLSRALADAGSAIAAGDARFWDLAPRHHRSTPIPVPNRLYPTEASR